MPENNKEWFEGEYWATISDDELPVVCFESEEAARDNSNEFGFKLVKVRVQLIEYGQKYLF